MKNYMVYIKSHCEAPDIENYYSEEELKDGKCKLWDLVGRCTGELIKKPEENGLKCKDCGAFYLDMDVFR